MSTDSMKGLIRRDIESDTWWASDNEQELLLADPALSILGREAADLVSQVNLRYPLRMGYEAMRDELMMLAPLLFTFYKPNYESKWAYFKMPHPWLIHPERADVDVLKEVLNAAGPVLVDDNEKSLAEWKEYWDDEPGFKVSPFDYLSHVPLSLHRNLPETEERPRRRRRHYGERTNNQLMLLSYSRVKELRADACGPRPDSPPTITVSDLEALMYGLGKEIEPCYVKIYYCRSSDRVFSYISDLTDVIEAIRGPYAYRATQAYVEFMKKLIKMKDASLRKWYHLNKAVAYFMDRELRSKMARLLVKGDDEKLKEHKSHFRTDRPQGHVETRAPGKWEHDFKKKLEKQNTIKKKKRSRRRVKWQKELANAAALSASDRSN